MGAQKEGGGGVTGTPDGLRGRLGGGVLKYPKMYGYDPHNALIILRYVSWGNHLAEVVRSKPGRYI